MLGRGGRDAPKDLPFRSEPAARPPAPSSAPAGQLQQGGSGCACPRAGAAPDASRPAAHPAHPAHPAHLPLAHLTQPRSREAKKVFESALMESRRMSMSFITPEHIALAVLAVGDAGSRALLEG